MTTPTSLQPLFKRVAGQDRHGDLLAVIVTLSSKPLDTVYQQTDTPGIPKVGLSCPWLDETMLCTLAYTPEQGSMVERLIRTFK